MLPTYISILIAIVLIPFESWLNVRKFRNEITINKKWRNVLRGAVGLALAFVTYPYWRHALQYWVFLATLFLVFFNPIIGKMWKRDPWYTNSSDFTDIFLGALPKWLRIIISFFILFIGVVIWQADFFLAFRHGIFESGFIHQFIDNAHLLI